MEQQEVTVSPEEAQIQIDENSQQIEQLNELVLDGEGLNKLSKDKDFKRIFIEGMDNKLTSSSITLSKTTGNIAEVSKNTVIGIGFFKALLSGIELGHKDAIERIKELEDSNLEYSKYL